MQRAVDAVDGVFLRQRRPNGAHEAGVDNGRCPAGLSNDQMPRLSCHFLPYSQCVSISCGGDVCSPRLILARVRIWLMLAATIKNEALPHAGLIRCLKQRVLAMWGPDVRT